ADSNYMVIMGLLEMDKNFRMKATKRLSFYGDYYYGEVYAARWLRNTVLQLIDSFPSDSILTWNDIQPQIYDAHYYVVLIEKEDGSITRLSGRPFSISEETSELSWFFCDSVETFIKKNKTIANQDSIRKVLRGYEKYVSEFNMYPPLPENVIIKFTPPSISDNF
ncbi:hypothetical protein LJC28_04760, partial [Dysgonomonas sp. OttesenSCG-928-D17]|nr:hypothetical protein [Dysgonomonas sp. OttesenSCG-928-D17]